MADQSTPFFHCLVEECLLFNNPFLARRSLSEQSAYATEESLVPSVGPQVNCGKTADHVRMPFGMVSGVGLGMGVLDFCSDRRRGGAVWG